MKFLAAILVVSVYLVSTNGTTKPGACPPQGDICVVRCTNDDSCAGAMKCVRNLIIIKKPYLFIENYLFKCLNGCGHTCQMPITRATTRTTTIKSIRTTTRTTKPGSCPTPGRFGICVVRCTNDDSCGGALKCVRNLIIINKPY